MMHVNREILVTLNYGIMLIAFLPCMCMHHVMDYIPVYMEIINDGRFIFLGLR